jgi:hypothetical protein
VTVGRLDRFLKLERARPSRGAPGSGPAARERFAQPAGGSPTAQAAAPSGSGAETDRFAPAAEPEGRAIGVLADDGGQPFIRCRNCRTDNHVTATRCSFCEASLTTPPQRAYNEALWAQHAAESAELRSHVQALQASRQAADEEARQAVLRSHTFELETREQERENEPPLGLRLARQIRDPRLRLLVLVLVAVVPVYLLFFTEGDGQQLGFMLAVLVGFLFRPCRLRRWMRCGTWTIGR